MDQVYVYAIAIDKWYLQPTSGSAPSPREWSCTVVTSADDKSSYQVNWAWRTDFQVSVRANSVLTQIHMYGGHRPEDEELAPIVDNYYILSIPQFVWTRAPAIPKPRTMSYCNLLGSHRMLIAGGFLESFLDCRELLRIVDLNTGKFINTFEDHDNYTVPSAVISDIGGGYLQMTL